MMTLEEWQMQLAAVQKLLPPSAIARGIPYDAARKVQGRLNDVSYLLATHARLMLLP